MGFERAVVDGDLGRSFRAWVHTVIPKSMAIESGLLAASGEAESDWVKPPARFQNFQATSAAATAKGTEESKSDDSKFEQLTAAMSTQNAQHEKGLTQMCEAQAQTQQVQTQTMQTMGMVFAGQEQQRVTNLRVAKSTEAISASSGCAIEAAPAPQEIVALPSALPQCSLCLAGLQAQLHGVTGGTLRDLLNQLPKDESDGIWRPRHAA